MALWIDTAAWPAHGRLWAHLISDASYDELHAFASAHDLPRRGFDRDHYDVPAEAVDLLVEAGASLVSSREVVARLHAAGLRRRKAQTLYPRTPGKALLRPRRLVAGDLVAVTATAGPIAAERLELGVSRLRSWGLRVKVMPHVLDKVTSLGYLAGTDGDRAADFETAWIDDEVAAVIAGRGGYGTQRMLDLLDWDRLARARPKILVGFSDLTALHQAVATRLGLVTLHAHVVTSLGRATEQSAEQMRSMLFEPRATDVFDGARVRGALSGSAIGVLLGGNLALLAAEVGTSFRRPAAGGIVLLEDVNEDPYRIDRLLTQLLRVGWFEGVSGIVLGTFAGCGDQADYEAVLLDRLLPLGVPLVLGFDAGHSTSSHSVPFGVRAALEVPFDEGLPSLRLAMPAFI